jgi:hypothetical protein
MHRKGHLTTYYARWMGHKIKSLLAADCKQRAANAASTVESHLSNGAMKEAWRALKGWYRSAEEQPPPTCPETMVKQTVERMDLSQGLPPWGKPSRLTSHTLRFPTTCPQIQSYEEW